MNPPVLYDYINLYNSAISPSTVHCRDVGLARFFQKYLLQKAISVFNWKLPENWDKDFFLYGLFCYGHMAVINTDKFGVVPQYCGLSGYNIYYRPTKAVITNPLLKGIVEPVINEQCTVFKMNADYSGIWDIVTYYADLMALCAQAAGVNLVNSKVSYLLFAENKAMAESYKAMMDKILSGDPVAVVDKNLHNEHGTRSWEIFDQDIKNNYIVNDVLESLRKIENMFSTAVGLPNANTEKKERMIVDEVNANNIETDSNATKWLERFKDVAEKTNKMFNLNIVVELRKLED
mgnify:CR=1 FL=1